MTGRAARTHNRYGGTSSMAADSGPASAMFFGTISPSSTCNTTTIVVAITNDTVCRTVSGMPINWKGFSNRCATAGSPTRPNRIEQIVIPSCAPASITGKFSPARMTVTALCLPCSARASSRSRRAEISANSAPTKNALAASRITVRTTPKKSPISVVASSRKRSSDVVASSRKCSSDVVASSRKRASDVVASSRKRSSDVAFFVATPAQLRQFQLIDPATIHLQHRGQPAHRVLQRCVRIERRQLDRLALLGDVAELLQHQATDGLVFAFGGPESGCLGHLVDAQQAGNVPAPTRLHDVN